MIDFTGLDGQNKVYLLFTPPLSIQPFLEEQEIPGVKGQYTYAVLGTQITIPVPSGRGVLAYQVKESVSEVFNRYLSLGLVD